MLKLKRVRKTFYLASEDAYAIEEIKQKYGLSTDSDCVRLALRVTAASGLAQLPKQKKGSKVM